MVSLEDVWWVWGRVVPVPDSRGGWTTHSRLTAEAGVTSASAHQLDQVGTLRGSS